MLYAPLAAICLTTIALAASGCGGSKSTSGGNSSTTTSSAADSSPATFIAQGDSICGRLETELSGTKFSSDKGLEAALPQLASYEQAALGELSKLSPPASLASTWPQLLTDLRTWASTTAKLGEAAKVGGGSGSITSGSGATLAHALAKAHLAMDAIARKDGFKVCSKV